MTIELIKVNELQAEIKSLLTRKTAVTLSLAYYSMINGNATPLKGFDKTITSNFDSQVRKFVCIKWDKEKNDWVYNKSKAEKLLKELNLTFQDTKFEDFVSSVYAMLQEPAPEISKEEQTAKDLKSCKSRVKKAVETLFATGCSKEQVEAILADAVLMATAGKLSSAA